MAATTTDRKGSAMTTKIFFFDIDTATALELGMALNANEALRPVVFDGIAGLVSGFTAEGKAWFAVADSGRTRRICREFVGKLPCKIFPVVAGRVIPI